MPSTKFLPLLPMALMPFYATLLFKAAYHKAPLVRLTFEDEYDYIVVGGGSAGAVVASRLSEDPEVSVLLLEAGRVPNFFLDVPLLAAEIQQTKFDWAYLTVPQEAACFGLKNRQSRWPRGKVLGGSSILNYMLYIRGNRRDYDRWEQQLGCEGWGWRSVLPYFIKSEDNRDPVIAHNGYHGRGGYLTVSTPPYASPLAHAFVEAGETLGYPNIDLNGPFQTGFAIPQSTLRRGARCSTAKAFLEPCRGRPNLHILVRAHVTKVLFDENRRARTVLFRYRRLQRAVRARQEIILSAGSIGSAQLLMLSGVGPRLHLESLGIPVTSDIPVGENLQDHIGGAGISFMINDSVSVVRKRFNPKTAFDYFIKGQGPLTVPGGVEGIGFVRTKYNAQHSDWPDVEVHFVSSTPAADGGRTIRRVMGMTDELFDRVYRPYLNMDGFTMYPVLLRPKSRGWIRLRSTNPDDYPLINPGYLTRIEDVRTLVEGMKQLIALGYSEPFRKYDARIFEPDFPGCEPYAPYSDEHLACIARTYTATIYHPSGTCRMGRPELPTTVVDPQLRVKGVLGLRVVDASVFPEIPSGNTNAPVIMVAEKASDMIRHSRRVTWGTNYLNWWLSTRK
ncbi:glucose dehydrogenase [FAD, quinone]-like [Dermacentor silvarum]|uniref:glucose dehydrogenase [FAD, quinone]-like n=1 Tax=Dermacentor silvarum TaxID=543639 RepID=UPI001899C0A9|nr:glucose dehydrogenase [FAD, quinone]-like [Dermacentor silvarum]